MYPATLRGWGACGYKGSALGPKVSPQDSHEVLVIGRTILSSTGDTSSSFPRTWDKQAHLYASGVPASRPRALVSDLGVLELIALKAPPEQSPGSCPVWAVLALTVYALCHPDLGPYRPH